MGYRITWLAVKGLSKSNVLAHFGMRDTRQIDEANEAMFSIAELPTGWTILWSNDPTFARVAVCTPLSLKAPVLSAWVNETTMLSSANYFERGQYLWFVGHDAQKGMDDLDWEGDIPSQFETIKNRLMTAQAANGGSQSDVDFIFDIPLELAQSICGYKHDLCEFEWGSPTFTVVEAKSSWFSRLFGKL